MCAGIGCMVCRAREVEAVRALIECREQRRDRFGVEVVGGLVKQDDIAWGEAEDSQRHTRLLAPRQSPNLPRRLLTGQPESTHHAAAALIADARVARPHRLRHIVECRHLLNGQCMRMGTGTGIDIGICMECGHLLE